MLFKIFLLFGLLVLVILNLGCSERTIEDEHGNMYVGEIKSGEPHGQGTLSFTNGEKYEGELREDNFHVQGVGYWEDGTKKHEGEWIDGDPVR